MAAPTFHDILGQDRAISVLRTSIASGRIHHAWVFHGPYGVGKGTTARAFAGLLLDPDAAPDLSGELNVDPDSPAQRMLRADTHPDLRIISKELALYSSDTDVRNRKQSTIPIDVVREFMVASGKLSGLTKGALASRVFVVEEAHLLDLYSTGTILKMLEEPAPGVVMILVTDRENRLHPTIRSRCQRVAFGRLSDEALREWWRRSGLSAPDAEREWVLSYADGSPGAAVRAVEAGLFGWADTLRPMLSELERGGFPVEMGATMAKLVNEWAEGWVKSHENASKDAANKDGFRMLMALLADWARRRVREAPDADAAERRVRAIEFLDDTERHVDSNVNLTLALDNLTARLAHA